MTKALKELIKILQLENNNPDLDYIQIEAAANLLYTASKVAHRMEATETFERQLTDEESLKKTEAELTIVAICNLMKIKFEWGDPRGHIVRLATPRTHKCNSFGGGDWWGLGLAKV